MLMIARYVLAYGEIRSRLQREGIYLKKRNIELLIEKRRVAY